MSEVPCIRGGSGEREAVVLLGANTLFKPLDKASDAGRYTRQVSRLLPAHRFTIVGYAGSSFEEIVRNIAGAIRTQPDVVVGISLGGMVAMRFAAEHPELARRLVLLVAAHRFSPDGSRRMERQFEALERGDFAALLRENAPLFRRPWWNWLVRMKLRKDAARMAGDFRDAGDILRDYLRLFGPEFQRNAEYCARIACPALVIGGTADQYFDTKAFEETAALIPGARCHLLPGETHMLPVERSRDLARAIAEFLS